MYTTTKNPPREAVLFPGGVLSHKSEQMFHMKHFAGSWRAAGPAARSAAETGGARLPAGTAGGLRPVSWILQRLPQQLPEATSTRMTPAIRAGMADKRSLPPGEAGISSSQLMVIISPAMQAVTMPMV